MNSTVKRSKRDPKDDDSDDEEELKRKKKRPSTKSKKSKKEKDKKKKKKGSKKSDSSDDESSSSDDDSSSSSSDSDDEGKKKKSKKTKSIIGPAPKISPAVGAMSGFLAGGATGFGVQSALAPPSNDPEKNWSLRLTTALLLATMGTGFGALGAYLQKDGSDTEAAKAGAIMGASLGGSVGLSLGGLRYFFPERFKQLIAKRLAIESPNVILAEAEKNKRVAREAALYSTLGTLVFGGAGAGLGAVTMVAINQMNPTSKKGRKTVSLPSSLKAKRLEELRELHHKRYNKKRTNKKKKKK